MAKLKLRSAAKGLSVEELDKLIAGLSTVRDNVKQKGEEKAEAARRKQIAKIRALMDEAGLDPKDLKATKPKRRRQKAKTRRATVKPKYRLMIKGVEHTWSGRGRPPKVFKDYFDKGNSKESCAI